jgi:hypothetical protein
MWVIGGKVFVNSGLLLLFVRSQVYRAVTNEKYRVLCHRHKDNFGSFLFYGNTTENGERFYSRCHFKSGNWQE